jgi:hypothetical protein
MMRETAAGFDGLGAASPSRRAVHPLVRGAYGSHGRLSQ